MVFRLLTLTALLSALGCGGGGARDKEKYKDFDTPKAMPTKR